MLLSPSLSALPSIRHVFFTRQGGVSQNLYASLNGGLGSNDDPLHVAENRRRMAEALGLTLEAMTSLYQVHSADAVIVETPWSPENRPRADGMATKTFGVALAIATADCGPVLLADEENGVIGACHAGWRGAVSGILEATLDAMETLGARRSVIHAALGPTIGPRAYEVGDEMREQCLASDSRSGAFFHSAPRRDRFLFDLPGFIGARLAQAGIARFENSDLCTYADEARFFSYRRATHRKESDYGRLISAIVLIP